MPIRESLPEVDHRATSSASSVSSAMVTLSLPADKDYVVLARSAVAHLGARVGLSMEEISDLRLAVSEACVLFLAGDFLQVVGETLDCTFAESEGALHVTVAASIEAPGTPAVDSFGWNLLAALVDELHWVDGDVQGRARVHLTKAPAFRGR